MILTLDAERLRTLAEVGASLDGSDPVDFRLTERDGAYAFVRRTLVRFRYAALDRVGRRPGADWTAGDPVRRTRLAPV